MPTTANTSQPQVVSANPAIGSRGDIHIYLPPGPGPHPFVLGIHGGAWRNGDQQSYAWIWPRLEALGIAMVLVSYRLTPEVQFPEPCSDLLHSLRWLKEQGGDYGLDTERCVLYGGSAGGHWVMLLGARVTAENLPAPRLKGIVNYCGIMDLPEQFAWDEKRGSEMVRNFLGGTPEEKPELAKAASPMNCVHAGMPPIWMSHGTVDAVVPIEQSRHMAQRLRELGVELTYLESEGVGHSMLVPQAEGATGPQEMLFEESLGDFLRKSLE